MTDFDPYRERRLFGRPLTLEPQATAVLVIDMLNDFCHQEGLLGNPDSLALCEKQSQILNSVRHSGGRVVFVNEQHRPNLRPRSNFARRMSHSREGTWGSEVVASLKVEDSDIVVIKRRYSGFFESDLDLVMRDCGLRHAILVGVLTNICVRATAHDAFFRGYDVVVPEDAVGAMSPLEQLSALYDISTHFGWVTTTAATLEALEARAPIENMDVVLSAAMNER